MLKQTVASNHTASGHNHIAIDTHSYKLTHIHDHKTLTSFTSRYSISPSLTKSVKVLHLSRT